MKNEHVLKADLDFVLNATSDILNVFKNKRIFVTGGTGFFGCWLLECFTWANDTLGLKTEIVVLTRNPDSFRLKAPHLANHPFVTLHQGDVVSFEFPQGNFDYVIHAATEASAKMIQEDPVGMIKTIVFGTNRVLEFAKNVGVKRFLLTSSGAVYGPQPYSLKKVKETYLGAPDTCNPNVSYGQAKRLAEQLCTSYVKQYGLECVIARCFAFVGPYLPLDIHYAAGNFINAAIAGGPIIVMGDGTPVRSYMYTADLVVWLWKILIGGESGRAYNVGSDQGISILELAEAVAGCVQPEPEIIVRKISDPAKKSERYVPDTSRAKKELDLKIHIDLKTGLRKTISYHLSDKSKSPKVQLK